MPIFKGPTKDQDRLGVPALMRKRTLYSRKRAEPIPLTALDRKKAGLPPPGLEKGRKRKAQEFLPALDSQTSRIQPASLTHNAAEPKRKKPTFNSQEFFAAPEFPSSTGILSEPEFTIPEPIVKPVKRAPRKPRARRSPEVLIAPRIPSMPRVKRAKKTETLAPQLMDFYATPEPKSIGEITHYYDKIKVGVIKLSSTLSVGDCIKFATLDGEEYEQVVESMEIDREPVFKAGKGKEVGLKLSRAPKEGSVVFKA